MDPRFNQTWRFEMADIDVTRIAGNIGAMNALNSLNSINKQLSIHQTRLASGKRINTAADDPAGLVIGTKMQSRSEGLKVALQNIGDAKNLLAVAESGLGRINDIVVQMRNKAEAGASDTHGSEERSAIVTQLQAYAAQIDDISTQTEWNSKKLLDGTAGTLTFQTGSGTSDYTTVNALANMGATGAGSLGLASKTTSASAAVVADVSDFLPAGNAPAAVAVANTNLAQLATGTYTLNVSVASEVATIHLLDSGGNEQLVSQTPVSGLGNVAKGVDQDTNGAITTVNFGNGLAVSLKADMADGNYTAQVSYTQTGSIAMTFNDGSGAVTLSAGSSAADFRKYMGWCSTKLGDVSAANSQIGALTGRLTFKEDQVSAAQINVEAAFNRIMNANMAEEQVNASKFTILQQTATAMLAQANAAPQFLLSLFR
jgi:flagellin